MHVHVDVYRMVIVNVLSSLLLLGAAFFYYFVYPKKKINLLMLLILISFLPVISITRYGAYESGDINTHIYRTIDFYTSLTQGILLPSWAGNLNATFGYPLFVFLNPLPYYLMAFFHFIGFSFIGSGKLLLGFSYIFSGIWFYLWSKKEVKNNFAAFSGAIIYLFAPYHLVDLHFRTDVGEVLFFANLPLFFYCLKNFLDRESVLWFLITSIVYSLLMFSHQAMAVLSLMSIVPYMVYCTVVKRNGIKKIIFSLLSIACGLIISSFTWVPHLVYPKYTYASLLTNQGVTFTPLNELLYSPWRYGFLFQGPTGHLSFLIGYTLLIILVNSIFLLIFKKGGNQKLPLLLWSVLSIWLIFLITKYSNWLWNIFPILGTIQFTTRLLLILVFVIATLMIYLTLALNKLPRYIWILLFLTIFTSILNWGNRRVIPEITDATFIKNLSYSTAGVEAFCCMAQPIWTIPGKWEAKIPNQHIQIIKGSGTIQQIQRTEIQHTYLSYATKSITVKENTWYFPGWNLLIDGKQKTISTTKGSDPGVILFTVPSGLHKITLYYEDIFPIKIAKIVSFITLFIFLLLIIGIILKNSIQKWVRNENRISHIKENAERKIAISLIIPTYNDEKTIIKQVLICEKILKKYCNDYEIIIADDFSTDKTRPLLIKYFKKNTKFKIIFNKKNLGITMNMRQLYSYAKKTFILLYSADGDWDPNDIDGLIKTLIDVNADIIIGKRKKKIGYNIYRNIISAGHKLLPFLLFGVNTFDPGGIKIVKRQLAQTTLISTSQFFEAEMIIRASKKGYKIRSYPVNYKKIYHGTGLGGGINAALFSIWDVLKLRINFRR